MVYLKGRRQCLCDDYSKAYMISHVCAHVCAPLRVFWFRITQLIAIFQSPSHVRLFVTRGLQHTRLPRPSPSPRVCPSSCPLHWWDHPTISSSDDLFSFCLQSFAASGPFPMSQLFTSDDWNSRDSVSATVLPIEYSELISLKTDYFDLFSVQGTLRSLLQHHSLKALLLWHSAFFTPSSHNCTWPCEDRSLNCTDLCRQRDVSAFQHTVQTCHHFPAKKQLSSDFMDVVTVLSDFGAQGEEICHCFHLFPLCLPWSKSQMPWS